MSLPGAGWTGLPRAIELHARFQTHGFVGLMIMGVSLHMVPRLFSRPIWWQGAPRAVLILCAGGLTLEVLSAGKAALSVAACSQASGILLYVLTLAAVVIRPLLAGNDGAVTRLTPYLLCSGIGWSWVAAIVLQQSATRADLRSLHAEVFLYLVLLPTALLFSAKLLPLFLGLREPRWAVGRIGAMYLIGALVFVSPRVIEQGPWGEPVAAAGGAMLSAAIVLFVISLDLFRRQVPERLDAMCRHDALRGRAAGARGSADGARPRWLPDNGQFGRFELCVMAAYVWLSVAAVGQLATSALVLAGHPPVPQDALRHAYVMGFGANLIVGVGMRLLPPLLSRKIVWRGGAEVAAALLNLAAICRVFPALFAGSPIAIGSAPGIFRYTFAVSGSLALLAVAAFGIALFGKRRVLY